jgi:transposase-like protein
MGRRGYPLEFRRKVLDLVEAGRPIAEVAKALGISAESIYTWRRQDRIDKGADPRPEQPRETSAEGRTPTDRAARDRAGGRTTSHRAPEGGDAPFRRFAAIQVMAEEGLPVQSAAACWRSRSPAITPGAAGHRRRG